MDHLLFITVIVYYNVVYGAQKIRVKINIKYTNSVYLLGNIYFPYSTDLPMLSVCISLCVCVLSRLARRR